MVAALLATVAALSLAAVAITNAANKEQRASRDKLAAQYVAEAGITQALFELQNGGTGVKGSIQNVQTFSQGSYWVDVTDLGGGQLSLESTGLDRGKGYRIDVVVEQLNTSNWVWAAFGDAGLTMDSNAFVDSYDSALGIYTDQDVNGSGASSYANSDGNIGSNNDVTLDQNAKVYGDANPGPAGTTTANGNSVISGSTTPSPIVMPLPPLTIPVVASAGDYTVPSSTTVSLGPGTFAFDDFTLNTGGHLNITGPVTLIVNNMQLDSNSEMILDALGGKLELYVLDDFVMDSNTLIASQTFTPADIEINLDSNNVIDPNVQVDLDQVDLNSNAQIYGTIYAPNASVEINSNFELFGALTAYSVHLDSNCKIHYDEALATGSNVTGNGGYQTVMWKGRSYVP